MSDQLLERVTELNRHLARVEGGVSRLGSAARYETDRIRSSLAAVEGATLSVVGSSEMVADEIAGLESTLSEGIDRLDETLNWGFSQIAVHLELQTEELRKILEALRRPLNTQARELRTRAEFAFMNGWMEEARRDFLTVAEMQYADFTAHYYLGNILLLHDRNPHKAIDHYRNAAKYARPMSQRVTALAQLQIGFCYRGIGDFERAYEATSEAVRLHDAAHTRFEHGVACLLAARWGEAKTHLVVAIKLDARLSLKLLAEDLPNQTRSHIQETLKEALRVWRQSISEACDRAEQVLRKAQNAGLAAHAPEAGDQLLATLDSLRKQSQRGPLLEQAELLDLARKFRGCPRAS